jgi:alpha-L-fucosidase
MPQTRPTLGDTTWFRHDRFGLFLHWGLYALPARHEWMKRHSRSICGCTQAPDEFPAPQDCRLTYNPERRRLYVHVYACPFRQLHLDGFAGRAEYAQLLNDASEVKLTTPPAHQAEVEGDARNTLTLELPVQKPNVAVPVVELFLK